MNKQREVIILNRQGAKQQRPESLTPSVNSLPKSETPPGIQVNSGYINHTEYKTHSKKDAPQIAYKLSISGTLGDTGV